MGTLNKFAGKIKNFFGIGSKTAKNAEQSFQRRMENAQAETIEKRSDKKESVGTQKPVLKRSYKHRQPSKPPWWVRFYGKRTRAEVGTLNLHMVRHFGSFSPVKKIGD